MEFTRLLEIVGDAPVFETGLLLAGDVAPSDIYRQLSRWTASERLYQLRRGVYALAPPFQKVKPHPFVIANTLLHPSYVSLQAALAYYGLIPDYTPVTTSVTTARAGQWRTTLGEYTFKRIKPAWWQGYRQLEVSMGQSAWVATPEKALLDLVYLTPGGDDPTYLASLRLQALDRVDMATLESLASMVGQSFSGPQALLRLWRAPQRRSTNPYERLPARPDSRRADSGTRAQCGARISSGAYPG